MAIPPRGYRFADVLTEAIKDLTENGYSSEERVLYWMQRIRESAEASMTPLDEAVNQLTTSMRATYDRLVEREGLLRLNPGVSRFTLTQVKPKLRAELDRRIMASASLIKLNRQASVEKTLQRFSGWATSIPPGGTDVPMRGPTKIAVRKALAQLPFEERCVAIDQGHKFTANLSAILAHDGGAIAGLWRSNWRQINYNYRKDHKERDRLVYLIRDSWAHQRKLVKPGPPGYTDQITQPGEEIFCRCFYRYLYSIEDLPADMITTLGRAEIERTNELLRA